MEDTPLIRRRQSSFRKFVYSSLRITKKGKVATDETDDRPIYRVESIENRLTICTPIREEPQTVKLTPIPSPPVDCKLVRLLERDGKPFDPNCKLTSYERKRRARHEFGVANHANAQLFCPQQASQIELNFRLQVPKEVLVRVTAPNGEVSGLMHPTRTEMITFNPSKVGCGHGKWIVEIVTRDGVRFRLCHKETLLLNGQGCLTYEIDHLCRLRLVEQLWLNFY